jgi:cell division protein FtsI (penicillin-binding protein 3)
VIELETEPKVYTDVGRTYEEDMTVAEIVSRSSNIGTILIQNMIGNDVHYRYLAAFGLGQLSSGSFPGEATGTLRPAADWCDTTCGPNTAIGYRVDVTPLQMAAVFATIANNGVWVEPHIVHEVINPDLSRERYEPVRRPVLSEHTARIMQRLLQGVVESSRGTGRRAAVEGYTVGGKTGTTEKYLQELQGYSEDDRIASFIGLAPVSDPQIVVAVVLDSPHGLNENGDELYFGGVSAAPVFAEIAEAALHQLGVAPDAR